MTVCYWCGAKDTLADVGKELDDGKYKMVQCSKCKNAYYVVNKEKMNKQKQQTNEEWLRSATTEELAIFLNLIVRVGPYENEPKDFWEHVYGRGGEHGAKSIVEWLKQPHTTKE